jgi:hypothetical protein
LGQEFNRSKLVVVGEKKQVLPLLTTTNAVFSTTTRDFLSAIVISFPEDQVDMIYKQSQDTLLFVTSSLAKYLRKSVK